MARGRRRPGKTKPAPPRCATTGKVRFASREDAESEMRFRQALHHRNNRVPRRVYRCDGCDGFHLTKQKEKPHV